jgi:hypothetical protein
MSRWRPARTSSRSGFRETLPQSLVGCLTESDIPEDTLTAETAKQAELFLVSVLRELGRLGGDRRSLSLPDKVSRPLSRRCPVWRVADSSTSHCPHPHRYFPSDFRISALVASRSGFKECTDMIFSGSSFNRSMFSRKTIVPTTGGFGTGLSAGGRLNMSA